MKCAFCENPLICEACGAEFVATTPELYDAISRCDETVPCPACEALLVCHWCKTPYGADPQGDHDKELPSGEGPL